jgi:hypothetical protein
LTDNSRDIIIIVIRFIEGKDNKNREIMADIGKAMFQNFINDWFSTYIIPSQNINRAHTLKKRKK